MTMLNGRWSLEQGSNDSMQSERLTVRTTTTVHVVVVDVVSHRSSEPVVPDPCRFLSSTLFVLVRDPQRPVVGVRHRSECIEYADGTILLQEVTYLSIRELRSLRRGRRSRVVQLWMQQSERVRVRGNPDHDLTLRYAQKMPVISGKSHVQLLEVRHGTERIEWCVVARHWIVPE